MHSLEVHLPVISLHPGNYSLCQLQKAEMCPAELPSASYSVHCRLRCKLPVPYRTRSAQFSSLFLVQRNYACLDYCSENAISNLFPCALPISNRQDSSYPYLLISCPITAYPFNILSLTASPVSIHRTEP